MTETSARKSATAIGASEREHYLRLDEIEWRFNQLEFEVRKIASVWMIAIFSAIAFLVRGELNSAVGLAPDALLLCLIALFGNVGLLTLWFLDQRVYHQLLDSAFGIGLEIERRNPEIPPLRARMWRKSGMRGMARFQTLFYAVPMSVAAIAGGVGLGLSFPAASAATNALMAVCVLLSIAIPVWVARDWLSRKRLPALDGDERSEAETYTRAAREALKRWEKRSSSKK